MSTCSSATAIVDLPDAERPVIHTVAPFWPMLRERSSLVTVPSCQVMLVASCLVMGPRKRSKQSKRVKPDIVQHQGPNAESRNAEIRGPLGCGTERPHQRRDMLHPDRV